MEKIYTFHYPNEVVKNHVLVDDLGQDDLLDGVFWNSGKFYQISEISENSLWLDEISKEYYFKYMYKFVRCICGKHNDEAFMSSIKEL